MTRTGISCTVEGAKQVSNHPKLEEEGERRICTTEIVVGSATTTTTTTCTANKQIDVYKNHYNNNNNDGYEDGDQSMSCAVSIVMRHDDGDGDDDRLQLQRQMHSTASSTSSWPSSSVKSVVICNGNKPVDEQNNGTINKSARLINKSRQQFITGTCQQQQQAEDWGANSSSAINTTTSSSENRLKDKEEHYDFISVAGEMTIINGDDHGLCELRANTTATTATTPTFSRQIKSLSSTTTVATREICTLWRCHKTTTTTNQHQSHRRPRLSRRRHSSDCKLIRLDYCCNDRCRINYCNCNSLSGDGGRSSSEHEDVDGNESVEAHDRYCCRNCYYVCANLRQQRRRQQRSSSFSFSSSSRSQLQQPRRLRRHSRPIVPPIQMNRRQEQTVIVGGEVSIPRRGRQTMIGGKKSERKEEDKSVFVFSNNNNSDGNNQTDRLLLATCRHQQKVACKDLGYSNDGGAPEQMSSLVDAAAATAAMSRTSNHDASPVDQFVREQQQPRRQLNKLKNEHCLLSSSSIDKRADSLHQAKLDLFANNSNQRERKEENINAITTRAETKSETTRERQNELIVCNACENNEQSNNKKRINYYLLRNNKRRNINNVQELDITTTSYGLLPSMRRQLELGLPQEKLIRTTARPRSRRRRRTTIVGFEGSGLNLLLLRGDCRRRRLEKSRQKRREERKQKQQSIRRQLRRWQSISYEQSQQKRQQQQQHYRLQSTNTSTSCLSSSSSSRLCRRHRRSPSSRSPPPPPPPLRGYCCRCSPHSFSSSLLSSTSLVSLNKLMSGSYASIESNETSYATTTTATPSTSSTTTTTTTAPTATATLDEQQLSSCSLQSFDECLLLAGSSVDLSSSSSSSSLSLSAFEKTKTDFGLNNKQQQQQHLLTTGERVLINHYNSICSHLKQRQNNQAPSYSNSSLSLATSTRAAPPFVDSTSKSPQQINQFANHSSAFASCFSSSSSSLLLLDGEAAQEGATAAAEAQARVGATTTTKLLHTLHVQSQEVIEAAATTKIERQQQQKRADLINAKEKKINTNQLPVYAAAVNIDEAEKSILNDHHNIVEQERGKHQQERQQMLIKSSNESNRTADNITSDVVHDDELFNVRLDDYYYYFDKAAPTTFQLLNNNNVKGEEFINNNNNNRLDNRSSLNQADERNNDQNSLIGEQVDPIEMEILHGRKSLFQFNGNTDHQQQHQQQPQQYLQRQPKKRKSSSTFKQSKSLILASAQNYHHHTSSAGDPSHRSSSPSSSSSSNHYLSPKKAYPNNTLIEDLSKCHSDITHFCPRANQATKSTINLFKSCWSPMVNRRGNKSSTESSNQNGEQSKQTTRLESISYNVMNPNNLSILSNNNNSTETETKDNNNDNRIRPKENGLEELSSSRLASEAATPSSQPNTIVRTTNRGKRRSKKINYRMPESISRVNSTLKADDYDRAISVLNSDIRFKLHLLLYRRVQTIWTLFSTLFCILIPILLFTHLETLIIVGACLSWLSLQLIGFILTTQFRKKLDQMLENSVAQVNSYFLDHNLMIGVINVGSMLTKARLLIPILYFDTSQCREQIESIVSNDSQKKDADDKIDKQQRTLNYSKIGLPLSESNSVLTLAQSQLAKKIVLRYSQRWISYFDKRKLMFADDGIKPRHLSTGKCLCQFIEEHFKNDNNNISDFNDDHDHHRFNAATKNKNKRKSSLSIVNSNKVIEDQQQQQQQRKRRQNDPHLLNRQNSLSKKNDFVAIEIEPEEEELKSAKSDGQHGTLMNSKLLRNITQIVPTLNQSHKNNTTTTKRSDSRFYIDMSDDDEDDDGSEAQLDSNNNSRSTDGTKNQNSSATQSPISDVSLDLDGEDYNDDNDQDDEEEEDNSDELMSEDDLIRKLRLLMEMRKNEHQSNDGPIERLDGNHHHLSSGTQQQQTLVYGDELNSYNNVKTGHLLSNQIQSANSSQPQKYKLRENNNKNGGGGGVGKKFFSQNGDRGGLSFFSAKKSNPAHHNRRHQHHPQHQVSNLKRIVEIC